MENLSKRAAASRANGAKSRGPRTSAGRQRSSLNAIRHGYLSKCVVLDSENKDGFKAHHEHYIKTFNPTDGVEDDLVEEMVSSAWRLGRLQAVENALFNKAFEKSPGLAGAFSELATNNEFALVHRYQSSVHRMFQRSFKNLILLRQFKAQEPNEPEEELPNEPETDLQNEPKTEKSECSDQIPNEPNSAPKPESGPLPNEPKFEESDLCEQIPNEPSTALEPASGQIPNEPRFAPEPVESATSTGNAPLPNEPKPDESSSHQANEEDANEGETNGEDEDEPDTRPRFVLTLVGMNRTATAPRVILRRPGGKMGKN